MNQFNRALIIDNNFLESLKSNSFPKNTETNLVNELTIDSSEVISIFESQVHSRHIDIKARELKETGQCFYTIGSSGHEANAVFGNIFPFSDIAFLHYRSGPFFIERSKQLFGSTPIYDLALSFMASAEDPISGGRHKVLGSKPLNIPPQTSTIASHIPKAVGAAFSIDRAKDLRIKEKELKSNSIVICSFGDASANHASALTGFNTSRWVRSIGGNVPIVFICEDNGVGISVPTPDDWIKNTYSRQAHLKYFSCNGLNILDTIRVSKMAEQYCRSNRAPVFLHMKTVRLMGHAGSDIESSYLEIDHIESTERKDPLLYSASALLENNILSSEEILNLYEHARKKVNYIFDKAATKPRLSNVLDVMKSIVPANIRTDCPTSPQEEKRAETFGKEYKRMSRPAHMAKLINYALADIMLQYKNALIFGEDVAKKGGVYNVTSGLYKQFSSRRVFNSPLDETSIIGFAAGLAHNGFLPIPEIQFLAYFHNAEDQLRGEAATLSFFSQSQYTNPMVIRIAGLAYQKGFGGHFHNDNSLSVFRDIPGVIVACPSNGSDAVKMLRTASKHAYKNGRIIVFIEPIALYMTKDLHEDKDNKWCFKYPGLDEDHEIGEFVRYGNGDSLTIISYGNGLYHSLKALPEIEKKIKKKIKVIDLCWLSDINIDHLIAEIGLSNKILIVDECRRSGSYGEGLMSSLYSKVKNKYDINLHAAADSFIPLGDAATSTLPNSQTITFNALQLYQNA
jgi:2-oxoisovalerate dehydrogenase E1 component